jgi:hypothetical protein
MTKSTLFKVKMKRLSKSMGHTEGLKSQIFETLAKRPFTRVFSYIENPL